MLENGNNGNGFYFRSEAGAKIYEKVMRTRTGGRLARLGGDFSANFDATQRIKQDIDTLFDSMLLKEGESMADNYSFRESAVVYLSGKTGLYKDQAVQWANSRTKERLMQRKHEDIDSKLEGLASHCANLTQNCDEVIVELDERADTVTRDFYTGLERAKNLRTVVDEYEGRIAEIGDEIPELEEKDYLKQLNLERELSGLRRDHSSVVAELDDANFQVQMGKKELEELDSTSTYLSAVRANNAKSEQRFRFLLAQARRKQYNLSPLIVDAEKLVEGDELAKEQSRTDAIYSKVMNRIVDLMAETFGTPLPPSRDSVKDFKRKRKDEVARVKKDFDGLIHLEQERLDRLLEA